MGKLIPIIFLLAGLGVGAGAGFFLAPAPTAEAPTPETDSHDDATAKAKPDKSHDKASDKGDAKAKKTDGKHGDDHKGEGSGYEYVKINNQFVVPLVRDDRISGMVVLSLSLEVPAGHSEDIYAREPKLRDAMLGVLFDHANIGGFDGAFTSTSTMDVLRTALRETARQVAGPVVEDVLILDIARQDT